MSTEILFAENELNQMIKALGDKISEDVNDLDRLVLVGIWSEGVPITKRIKEYLNSKTEKDIPLGKLDISLYRDDLGEKGSYITIKPSEIPCNLDKKIVVLIDDVLFHGRTIRAAMDGLLDFGRPDMIKLGVLIDRGDRELPIEANYVAKKMSLPKSSYIRVKLVEIDGEDAVVVDDMAA